MGRTGDQLGDFESPTLSFSGSRSFIIRTLRSVAFSCFYKSFSKCSPIVTLGMQKALAAVKADGVG